MIIQKIKQIWERLTATKIIDSTSCIKFVTIIGSSGKTLSQRCYVHGMEVIGSEYVEEWRELFVKEKEDKERSRQIMADINETMQKLKVQSELFGLRARILKAQGGE